jgi:hypothetical protein
MSVAIPQFMNDTKIFVAVPQLILATSRHWSVQFLVRRISHVARPILTEQYKHRIKAHRHSCLEWDSNPRPQSTSRRRRLMS